MKTKEIKKISADIVSIIQNSKATFFVGKGTQSRIPTEVWLAELKAQITTNVEMYFYKLLEK
jgi:hypothetical protein